MFWTVSLLIVILAFLWFLLRKPSDYPPGPWGLPLIGWPPLSLEDYCQKLLKYREMNHDIIGWRIGSKFVVTLLDYDLLKEAFHHPDIAFRPEINTLTFIRGHKDLGIIHSGNVQHTQNRRFILRQLRDFGMGKEKLLLDSHFEADNFINDWKKEVNKPTTIPRSLLVSSLNNVWQMVASKRYEYNDKELNYFVELAADSREYGSRMIILDLFPWLENVLPPYVLDILFKLRIQNELSDKLFDFYKNSLQSHMKDLNENIANDITSAYLHDMEKKANGSDSFMSINDLTIILADLFVGAIDTTTHTIHWAVLYLAKYQMIQKKLQEEIDRVLPKGTQFLMKDKIKLPYTEAFITEILRISSVAPSPPRATVRDTKIGPYVIPKGSWVLGQSWIVHRDPKYWDSPLQFRPERFLDAEGNFVLPSKGFIPFGTGRRSCIGETIARMQLFVYMTKIVQNLHFDPLPGEKISLEGNRTPFFMPPKGYPKFLIKSR